MGKTRLIHARVPQEVLDSLELHDSESIRNALRVLSLSTPDGFSHPELLAIADATLGWAVTPETVRYMWVEVEDADRLEGLGRKWGIDVPRLLERLRQLCPAEAWMLLIRARREAGLASGADREGSDA